MQRLWVASVVVIAFVLGAGTRAHAQPRWDSRGWVMLGERTVNGQNDRDRIDVGAYEGTFGKLQVVVEDSELEMLDMKIEFADHTKYHPTVAQYFRENTKTRQIDMPPGEQHIRAIEFKYRNAGVRDGRNARVQVWGFRTGAVAPPPPQRFQWDTTGWQNLGEQTVDGSRHVDHDRIAVGAYEGRFSKIQIVVDDSDLEMFDLKITFTDNTNYHPTVSKFFKEGQRTHAIDLPPGEHRISAIDFRYRNLPGDRQRARVQAWGLRMAAPPPPPRYQWDTTGWQNLGEQTVDGTRHVDHDRITVGAYEGRFSKLQVVVDDSDLEMFDLKITFADNTNFHPKVAKVFRDGQRTHAIDLPPGEHRIATIDFSYRNLPTDRQRARVQVWGFRIATPVRAWDSTGWVMLGEREVEGHRHADHESISVGRSEGRFSKLTLVVLDADMEMIEMVIHLRHGQDFRPDVAQFFRENSRTRVIDLPGDRDRTIESIDFKYRNLPGEGHAKVQVWAK